MRLARPATLSKTLFQGASSLVCVALALGAQAAAAQNAPAPATAIAPAASPLAQIPGVTVQYYDVTGKTIEAIRASILAQSPKDPASGEALTTTAKWSIGTSVKKQTTGTVCKIVGATATIKSEVVLPRLATTEGVPAPVLAQWQSYIGSLESQQAARIRPIYDRLSEVEKAVVASSCEGAAQAADKAIGEISKPVVVPAAAPAAPAPATK